MANPSLLKTRLRHLSSSIWRTVLAFFNSRFATLISIAIWGPEGQELHLAALTDATVLTTLFNLHKGLRAMVHEHTT